MSWWISNPSRAKAEKKAIEELFELEEALAHPSWRLGDNLQLCMDFDIRHLGEEFRLSILFPSTFPDTPPMVISRDGERVSHHQYGADGELCLEYRPDNWDFTYTGAMMVGSALRLIVGERPSGGGRIDVLSAHEKSLGRDLRGKHCRFVLTSDAEDCLNKLPLDHVTELQGWETSKAKVYVGSLVSIGQAGGELWQSGAPKPAVNAVKGYAYRTELAIDSYRNGHDTFFDHVAAHLPILSAAFPDDDFGGFVLLGNEKDWIVLYVSRYGEKTFAISYAIIRERSSPRLPDGHADTLGARRVALIGCGSVGSKVSTMLARSGVSKFTLIDDDVLLFGNLVRNDLDVSGVGRHKVDAVASRIRRVTAKPDILVRRIALGTQESASSLESVMEALGECDLIIDATADASAFNLAAAASRRYRKPLIWCEVFGGGIGGLIARVRPDIDPLPGKARSRLHVWCDSHDVPRNEVTENAYEVLREDRLPLIADDADVTVIAAHVARYAIDLLSEEGSRFPFSAYAIGMSAGWIFASPFDTFPIDLGSDGPWMADDSSYSEEELFSLISDLFPRAEAEA